MLALVGISEHKLTFASIVYSAISVFLDGTGLLGVGELSSNLQCFFLASS